MSNSATPDLLTTLSRYEAWLDARIPTLTAPRQDKYARMAADPFAFLRAGYPRWAQQTAALLSDAPGPVVLAVGDLHVENFGTRRDAESRLVWGSTTWTRLTGCRPSPTCSGWPPARCWPSARARSGSPDPAVRITPGRVVPPAGSVVGPDRADRPAPARRRPRADPRDGRGDGQPAPGHRPAGAARRPDHPGRAGLAGGRRAAHAAEHGRGLAQPAGRHDRTPNRGSRR
jgi:hypothetical protein